MGTMSATPRSGPPRPPTLRAVAELAGVSIKTVSNVVNDFPHVRESTRERVQEAVLQLGYRPQAAAQQLRTGASRMVTLALPSLDRKSTRLNSSHVAISYAVFCLKKKKSSNNTPL